MMIDVEKIMELRKDRTQYRLVTFDEDEKIKNGRGEGEKKEKMKAQPPGAMKAKRNERGLG